ncbi:CRISPR-associated endonuclease Cas2 [Mobilicoccus massiliensis]|uniref:CRISPR-associated endonuclease Cas2 n=1 Tax=Mobilicoccus massiliensis TaxID=1522310 RepID=UPI00058EE97E|nr:CRISPR-associated endonuclease Cas2 [Mobilicoccus massiliensis]
MARRRHLIAYDIAEDKRLRRVAKVMEAYGERLQYSVFLCDLSGAELISWRQDLLGLLDLSDDSVVVIDLGVPGTQRMEVIGKSRRLPSAGPFVV